METVPIGIRATYTAMPIYARGLTEKHTGADAQSNCCHRDSKYTAVSIGK